MLDPLTMTSSSPPSPLSTPSDFALALADLPSIASMLATSHNYHLGAAPAPSTTTATAAPRDWALRRPSLAAGLMVCSSSTPESDFGARRGSLASLLTSDDGETAQANGGGGGERTSLLDSSAQQRSAVPPPLKPTSISQLPRTTGATTETVRSSCRRRSAARITSVKSAAAPIHLPRPSHHRRLLRRQAKALARSVCSAATTPGRAYPASCVSEPETLLIMSAGGYSLAGGLSSHAATGTQAPYHSLGYSHVPFQPTSSTLAHARSSQQAAATAAGSAFTTTSGTSTPQLYDPMIHGQRPMPSSPPPSRSAASHPMSGVSGGGGGGGLMIDMKPSLASLSQQPAPLGGMYPHSAGPASTQRLPHSMQVPARPRTATSLGRSGAGGSSGSETTAGSNHRAPSSSSQMVLHSDGGTNGESTMIGPDGLHVPIGVSGGKLFRCRGFEGCEMTFTRSEHLARHVRKHTGERPFPCHCGKSFSRLDNLRQHAATVHSDQPDLNARMLHQLAPVHAALSQRAGKDQKRRGEVLELAKQQQQQQQQQQQASQASSHASSRRASHAQLSSVSHAAPPYPALASDMNTQRKSKASAVGHGRFANRGSVSGMPVPPPPPPHRVDHYQRLHDPMPPSTANSFAGWDHQPPPPASTRPGSSAGRPVTSESSYRPMTGIEAASRPLTGATVSRPRTSGMPKSSRPPDESDPHFSYDPMPYAAHAASQSMRTMRTGGDASTARGQGNPYSLDPTQLQRDDNAWSGATAPLYHANHAAMPTQMVYASSAIPPYSGVPPSTAPSTAPFQYQFGNTPSFGHQQAVPSAAASGISGPASQSQIQQIYGNSAGPQEDPFSYHPPPTATLPPQEHSNGGYVMDNGGPHHHVQHATGPSVQTSMQSAVMHRDPSLASRDDISQNGGGPDLDYGNPYRPPRAFDPPHQGQLFTMQPGLGERRSSLAISSLLADDVPVMRKQQAGPQHEQTFYPSQQDADDMQNYSFGGAESGEFEGRFPYSEVAPSWEPQQQQELVGAMDAKAKALLGSQYSM